MTGKSKGFTLIEIVLATTILLSVIAAIVINFNAFDGNRYQEARENLKTFLINKRHQAAYHQRCHIGIWQKSPIYFNRWRNERQHSPFPLWRAIHN